MPKNTSAAEKGYTTRILAGRFLREFAAFVETRDDGQLVKISVATTCTPDDGSCDEVG